MADAMCGPSNPLQQLKQQVNLDSSLQQDRLSLPQHPAPGFRSQHTSSALVNSEFEAFQSDMEPLALGHTQPIQTLAGFHAPYQAPSWATDFQQLHISPPSPMQQQILQQTPNTSNWAHGFREQLAQAAPKAQPSSTSSYAFQRRARMVGSVISNSSIPNQFFSPMQSKGKQRVPVEQFDDAAFERAFDQAREAMMTEVEQEISIQNGGAEELVERLETATEQEATHIMNVAAHDVDAQSAEDIIHRIHPSDIEHRSHEAVQEEVKSEVRQEHENDALAATAQELLEKVEHEKSDKFKNSQFLGLMRKLRDREVRVEGEKMVETVSSTLQPDILPTRTSTISPYTYNVSDHEFDHWESPYT